MKIRQRISNYKLKRRAKKAFQPDVTIDQFTSYLLGRVKECIRESVAIESESLQTAVRALRYIRNLILSPLTTPDVGRDVLNSTLNQIWILYARMEETMKLLDDAILLSMSGRYTTAFSTLRGAIECIIVGGFYQGLSDENFRKDPNLKRKFWGWKKEDPFFNEFLDQLLVDRPEVVETAIGLERLVEMSLEEKGLRYPSFNFMLKRVIDWYHFKVLEQPYEYIVKDFYGPLSVYTHSMSDAATYIQHMNQERATFDSGEVSDKMIAEFLEMFYKTLDLVGALFFTMAAVFYQLPGARTAIIIQESDLFAFGKPLTHTREALALALGVRRMNPRRP